MHDSWVKHHEAVINEIRIRPVGGAKIHDFLDKLAVALSILQTVKKQGHVTPDQKSRMDKVIADLRRMAP